MQGMQRKGISIFCLSAHCKVRRKTWKDGKILDTLRYSITQNTPLSQLLKHYIYLKRFSAVDVKHLPVPQVSLVSIFHPQHVTAACSRGPEVHCQAEHMRAKHVVVEAENTVLLGPGRVLAALLGRLKDSAQQHSRVLEILGRRGLYVEVVAVAGAQRVVLPGPRVVARSGALDAGPVEHVSSALFLFPAAQSMLEVTLQLWSCEA